MVSRGGQQLVTYEAPVTPGERYHIRVVQPPYSAVFLFDSSASIGPFQDYVYEGIRTFAAGVRLRSAGERLGMRRGRQ